MPSWGWRTKPEHQHHPNIVNKSVSWSKNVFSMFMILQRISAAFILLLTKTAPTWLAFQNVSLKNAKESRVSQIYVHTSVFFVSYCVQLCPTLSNFVQLCPTLSNFVQICPTLSNFVQLCPTLSNVVQLCPTLSNFFQLCPTLFHFCPALSNFVQLFPTLSNFVQLCPTLSIFVQLCPSLFNFVQQNKTRWKKDKTRQALPNTILFRQIHK